jgi:[ribosomal protein S18]-alanine N-acetyltransferase
MQTGHRIDLALRSDAQRIALMSRDHIEAGLGWSWDASRVRRSLSDPATNVVVVRDQSVALLRAFGIMHYGDDDAHLLLFAVDPAWRRRGLGTALLGWLEQVARAAGAVRVDLECRQSNAAALAFYAARGYAQTRLMPGYYQGRETSVRMRKLLRV